MDTGSLILVVGVLLVALFAVAGGIAALVTQRAVVDDAGHVTENEIPYLGKFKSNYPSIAAAVIGAALAYGTLYLSGITPEIVPITANGFVNHPNDQMKPTVLVGAILKGYSVDESQVAASLWRKIRVFVDKARSYGVIVYTPIHINPETGSTRFATVYGTPDVSNVIEAELEILR